MLAHLTGSPEQNPLRKCLHANGFCGERKRRKNRLRLKTRVYINCPHPSTTKVPTLAALRQKITNKLGTACSFSKPNWTGHRTQVKIPRVLSRAATYVERACMDLFPALNVRRLLNFPLTVLQSCYSFWTFLSQFYFYRRPAPSVIKPHIKSVIKPHIK